MSARQTPVIAIGGKQVIQWRAAALLAPVIILVTPITENSAGTPWTFWRWTLTSLISLIPLLFIYIFADVVLFAKRESSPIKPISVFLFGLLLGATHGVGISYIAHWLRLINEDFTQQLTIRVLNSAMAGLLLVPLISVIASAMNAYKFDRSELIHERMALESQKAESQAILKSMRASMSQKVDENLLQIVVNSKEFFDNKNRNLEENWQLLAERLRQAALQTVRPFSHSLHKRGEERRYSVKTTEFLRYIAHSIQINISWVLLIYGASTFSDVFLYSQWQSSLAFIGTRLFLILILILVMRFLKSRGYFRTLGSFSILLTLSISIFIFSSLQLQTFFEINKISLLSTVANGIWLALVILLVGFISAFINGQESEFEFIQKQLSQTEVEASLIRREEARVSRELAKYLHGTIQSRLMASAVSVERAGKSGDKKALQSEIARAYKNLKLPDESYFSTPEQSLAEEIKKIVAKWNNLIKVRVKIDKSVSALPENLSQNIGFAVNEALANSFRHGNATSALITISPRNSDLIIQISDNGKGPSKGKPGLGTEAFQTVAGSYWRLDTNPERSGALLLLRVQSAFLE